MNEILCEIRIGNDLYRIVSGSIEIQLQYQANELDWHFVAGHTLPVEPEALGESIGRLTISAFGDHNAREIFHS